MWIRSVTAHAFGDVTEKTLRFTNGLNIIVGANGTGKSTWHAAIYAALYGVPLDDTAPVDRRLARRRPRRGDGWSVSTTLVLDERREIDVSQNLLEPGNSTALDATTQTDVSAEIRQPHGGLDATPWLGLDRRSFAATAFVEQAYGLLASPDDTSGQAVRRAVATGTGDDAVRPAIDRITRHRQRVVGEATDVHSRYGQALARLHAAETARDDQRNLTDRRSRAESTVDSARRDVADVGRRLNAARLAQAEAEVQKLELHLAQARWDLEATTAARAAFDSAGADAENRHRQAPATSAELEAGAVPPADPRPITWRDHRQLWYLAGAVLLIGLVLSGASANTDFRPGIAGGGVTTGAALALGAWAALATGSRRIGGADGEETTELAEISGREISAQRQVVDEHWDALREALVPSESAVDQQPNEGGQRVADLERHLIVAKQRSPTCGRRRRRPTDHRTHSGRSV
jgi:AAA domain